MNRVKRKNLRLEYFLENILEFAIVSLENGVLGAHVERPLLHDSVLETTVCKIFDRLIRQNIIIQ